MEFDINICTGLNGEIIIEDYSREYDQYLSEDIFDDSKYKYDECKTINVINKITTDSNNIIEILIHNHDQLVEDPLNPNEYLYDLEKTKVLLTNDGYYIINHIILPTKVWFDKNINYIKNFEGVYIIDSDDKIYKYIFDTQHLEECSIEEIIKRNPENTTIKKCITDIFYTGFLQQCYINYAKKLFQKITENCDCSCVSKNNEELTYARDFLWMVLNIIDYYIGFNQFMEAQRLLEIINYCGNFCQNQKLKEKLYVGCGCS